MKPTYDELQELITELAEELDWYAPDTDLVNKVFILAEQLKEST